MKVINNIYIDADDIPQFCNYRHKRINFKHIPIENYSMKIKTNDFILNIGVRYEEDHIRIQVQNYMNISVKMDKTKPISLMKLIDKHLEQMQITFDSQEKYKVYKQLMEEQDGFEVVKLIMIILDCMAYVQYSLIEESYQLTKIIEKKSSKRNKNKKGNAKSKTLIHKNKYIIKYQKTNHSKNERHTDSWSVRGHYRNYKSGKTVWIPSYTKGDKNKDIIMNYELI